MKFSRHNPLMELYSIAKSSKLLIFFSIIFCHFFVKVQLRYDAILNGCDTIFKTQMTRGTVRTSFGFSVLKLGHR